MTHTYRLIEAKMNMKARKKKKQNKKKKRTNKKNDDMWLVFKAFSLCIFLILFQFSQVMSYGSRVGHEYETSVFFHFP